MWIPLTIVWNTTILSQKFKASYIQGIFILHFIQNSTCTTTQPTNIIQMRYVIHSSCISVALNLKHTKRHESLGIYQITPQCLLYVVKQVKVWVHLATTWNKISYHMLQHTCYFENQAVWKILGDMYRNFIYDSIKLFLMKASLPLIFCMWSRYIFLYMQPSKT